MLLAVPTEALESCVSGAYTPAEVLRGHGLELI